MIERVRGVLITPTNELVTIRRQRPDTPTYWVLPGGHVESTDDTLEQALHREIREELGGTASLHSLIHVLDGDEDRQHIYLGSIHDWSLADRSGPEFADHGRGSYDLHLVPFTTAGLASIDLKPDAVARLLAQTIRDTIDPFDLPDLRTSL
ncbi:NUDIX domain-containing protein [Natronosporangium hydrolyticum]|uniref:NUDIX domain-containing protein n=1 Tax=Natronosporangium hydrolyticum TaxID=2811111 RepID=A0A895Y8X2_9ACTN|nr:NUDIX domain-containing protein [Natronosporangium hydrolyticum]QSB14177.1 NUDIX domain-containing protein [Natronosporangium hydrolyticum]